MNEFRIEELVTINGKTYPVLGGRLRLLHEACNKVSVKSEILKLEVGEFVAVKVTVTTERGIFEATGTASASRDIRLQDALVELAESRGLARSLRWANFGLELGSEEIGDLFTGNQPESKPEVAPLRVVGGTKAPTNGDQAPKGNGGTVKPSNAQQKAIYALSKKLGLTPDQAVAKVYPGQTHETITLVQASALIDRLKAKAGNGSSEVRQ